MKVDENGTGSPPKRPLDILRPDDGDPRHGTVSAYNNHQCRCDLCRAGWASYIRDLRERKRKALGAA